MNRKRNDYPQVITPKGTVVWASLNAPDYDYKEEGEFHVRLRFDPANDHLSDLIAKAEEIRDEAFEEKKAELTREKKGALLKQLNKAPILSDEVDRESGDPTGYVLLRAGMKHRITIKNGPRAGETFDKKPDIFDARRVKLANPPKIGSGTEGKAAVRLVPYWLAKDKTIGVSFQLEAFQIIKLVSGGSRDAASYGFDEEDGDALQDTGGFSEETEGYNGGDDEGSGSDF